MPTFKEIKLNNNQDSDAPIHVDAKGSQCPGPIMLLAVGVKKAKDNQTIIVEATDPGFAKYAVSWAAVTCNDLESLD